MGSNVDGSQVVLAGDEVPPIETLSLKLVPSTGRVEGGFKCQMGPVIQVEFVHHQGTRVGERDPSTAVVIVRHARHLIVHNAGL